MLNRTYRILSELPRSFRLLPLLLLPRPGQGKAAFQAWAEVGGQQGMGHAEEVETGHMLKTNVFG